MRLCASVLAIAVLAPLSAFAQEPPPGAPPAVPPPGAPPAEAPPAAAPVVAAAPAAAPAKTWKDLITIEGLVDSYYMAYLNPPSGSNNSLTPPFGRQFDTNSNTFTLNYAKVGLGMSSDMAGFRIDMGYGATGAIINSATPPVGMSPNGTPATLPSAFIVQQAFATLTPITNLTIDFGKFVTTAGAEVIESNKNWLYSRSILFFNIPLLHNGIRAGYKINDMVSVQASLVNGWNGQGLDTYTTSAKTGGFNASITLPMGLSILPTVYVGRTVPGGSTRVLFDLVAAYTMGPWGFNLNFDYDQDKNADPSIDPFIGVAGMAHYTINDHVNATLRGEYAQQSAKDALGNTVTGKLWEVTAGVALPFSGHYELRPEFRYDGSSDAIFPNPMTPATDKKSQLTLTIAALAYF